MLVTLGVMQSRRKEYIIKSGMITLFIFYYISMQVYFYNSKYLSRRIKISKNQILILILLFLKLFPFATRTIILRFIYLFVHCHKRKQKKIQKYQSLFQWFRPKLNFLLSLNQNIPFWFVDLILCIIFVINLFNIIYILTFFFFSEAFILSFHVMY